jgi:two-component response regulator (ARR-B family)
MWDVGFLRLLVGVVHLCAEAVPKRILDLMGVSGLTRENVASHLQVRFNALFVVKHLRQVLVL